MYYFANDPTPRLVIDLGVNFIFPVGRACTKLDKVVKREICSIQTKGTKRFSFIDGDTQDSNSNFLLALCERVTTH